MNTDVPEHGADEAERRESNLDDAVDPGPDAGSGPLPITSSWAAPPPGPVSPGTLPRSVVGLRRTRKVLWIAVAVALPVVMLIVVLAYSPSAQTRSVDSPLLGMPAPPLEGTTVDGQQAGLTALGGRWVVVNFFATWCTPCVKEHPDLVRFQEAHKAAGDAEVIAVVYSDMPSAVREFRSKHGGEWPMLLDPEGRIALDYGVSGVPESFLVSPDGIIVSKILGGVRLDALEDLLHRAQQNQR